MKYFYLLIFFNLTYGFNLINLKSSLHDHYKNIQGRVLFPGMNGDKWWDSYMVSCPVVLPPNKKNNKWLMYYYGRDGVKWNKNITADKYLPTGYIGLAISNNGLNWSKVNGNYYKGSVMEPDNFNNSYENVHIGVSDVIYENNKYIMHYFGSNNEKILNKTGLKMRCLVAKSKNGIDWYKFRKPTVNIGNENEWDNLFTGFPRINKLEPNDNNSKWLITYHSLTFKNNMPNFMIGAALSDNKYGNKITKKGVILKPGDKNTWDNGGVGPRHIININNTMYMFYSSEGNIFNKYAIGLAYSKDKGETWHKLRFKNKKDPGGPIFEARYNNLDAWDNYGVACPFVLKKPDGNLRMYYLGIGTTYNDTLTGAIGCVECVNNDLTKWERV